MKSKLLNLFKDKQIAFLENAPCLDDVGDNLAMFLEQNNIPFQVIANVEEQGLESVLRQCLGVEVIIFHTTWTYPVSKELKKAFMSIQNPEHKKAFVEMYVNEPTFDEKPDTIHDMYILNCYSSAFEEWEFYKLEADKSYWEL